MGIRKDFTMLLILPEQIEWHFLPNSADTYFWWLLVIILWLLLPLFLFSFLIVLFSFYFFFNIYYFSFLISHSRFNLSLSFSLLDFVFLFPFSFSLAWRQLSVLSSWSQNDTSPLTPKPLGTLCNQSQLILVLPLFFLSVLYSVLCSPNVFLIGFWLAWMSLLPSLMPGR